MKTTQEVLISLAEEVRNMHPKANKDGIAAHIAMKAQESTSPGNGWVLMPEELTAENGAKNLLMGEFEEVVELECGACDEDDEDCEVCGGNGSYTYRVPVSWTTIKAIYKLAAEKLKRPQPPTTGESK